MDYLLPSQIWQRLSSFSINNVTMFAEKVIKLSEQSIKLLLRVVSIAQIVKTPNAAVLGAVAALVRVCMAWVRIQAKALRNYNVFVNT